MALDPEFEVDLAPVQGLHSASRGDQEPVAEQDRVKRLLTPWLHSEFRHRFGVPAVRLVHRADVRVGHGDVKLHPSALMRTAFRGQELRQRGAEHQLSTGQRDAGERIARLRRRLEDQRPPPLMNTAAASYGSSVARIGVSTAPDYHSAENLADSRTERPGMSDLLDKVFI